MVNANVTLLWYSGPLVEKESKTRSLSLGSPLAGINGRSGGSGRTR